MPTLGKAFFVGLLFCNLGLICNDTTSLKLIGIIESNYRFDDLSYGQPDEVSEPWGFKVGTQDQVLQRFAVIQERFAADNGLKLEHDQSKIIQLCSVRFCMFLRNSGYASDVYWGYVDQTEKSTKPKKLVRGSVSYPYFF